MTGEWNICCGALYMVEALYELNVHKQPLLLKMSSSKRLLKILYLTCYNLRQNTAHESSIWAVITGGILLESVWKLSWGEIFTDIHVKV